MKAPSETGYMAAVTCFEHCRKHLALAKRPYILGKIIILRLTEPVIPHLEAKAIPLDCPPTASLTHFDQFWRKNRNRKIRLYKCLKRITTWHNDQPI
jgi:hypothetical protein